MEGPAGDPRSVAVSAGSRCRPPSQQEPFRVEADRNGGRITVRLIGDLDGRTTNPLYHLAWMLSHDGAVEVVLDMGALGFIDNSGVRELLLLHQQSLVDGFALRFVEVSDQTCERLRMRGLDKVFELVD